MNDKAVSKRGFFRKLRKLLERQSTSPYHKGEVDFLCGVDMRDTSQIESNTLSEAEAVAELARLSALLSAANVAYHREDAPVMSDAEFDDLKRRNALIEARFPHLRHADSISDQVGAAPADGFAKLTHSRRMLSLANAFSDEDIQEFDESLREAEEVRCCNSLF